MRFSACYSTVVASKPTGVNDDDLIRITTALFNGKKIKDPTGEVGKPFKFLGAWTILQKHEKFLAGSSSGSNSDEHNIDAAKDESERVADTASTSAPDTKQETIAPNSRSSGRPLGRRKAKQYAEKQLHSAKKIRIAERALQVQEARNVALTRHNEIMLFTNGPGGSESVEAREYFKLMQAEALSALRERVAVSAAKEAFAIAENSGEANNVNEQGDGAEDEEDISCTGAVVCDDDET